MRPRVARIAVGTLGTLLLVGGGATAAVAGPDGVLPRASVDLPLGPDGTARTLPTAFSATGGTVRITPSAPVFLGVGHPADVADVLRGRTVTNVTGTSSTFRVSYETGARLGTGAPVADPARLPAWTARATDGQPLDLHLDGAAHSVAAIGAKGSTLGLTLGYVLGAWVFWTALAIATVGLLLLGGAVLGGRRRTATATTTSPSPETTETTGAAPASGVAASSGAHTHRWRAAVVALALTGPALAGCAVPGAPVAAPPPSLERPSLTKAEVAALWKDYDRRNNPAIVDAAKNPALWEAADTGLVLEADRWASAVEKATKSEPEKPYTHLPGLLFAEASSSFPRFALVTSPVQGEKTDGWASVDAMVQEHVGEPWKMAAAGALPTSKMPKPLATPRPLTAQEASAVAQVAEQLRAAAEQGSTTGFTEKDPMGYAQMHTDCLSELPGATCRFYVAHSTHTDRASLGGAGSVQAVPVAGGVLALMGYRIQQIAWYSDKRTIINGADNAAVYGEQENTRNTYAWSATASVLIPPKGAKEVLGVVWRQIPLPNVPLP